MTMMVRDQEKNVSEKTCLWWRSQEPGSPEVTAVARISGNTPPKDTSEHVYEKPSNQSLISDAAGTQLFDATDGQNDSD